MPSWRRPRGTVIRTIPDWNLNNCASVLISNSVSGAYAVEAGLYNNSTAGWFLVVWGLSIGQYYSSLTNIGYFQAWVQMLKTPGVTPYQANNPVNPTSTVNFGVGWYNSASPGPQNENLLYPAPVGPGNWEWPHDFPIGVVPAGYSLSVVFTGGIIGQDGQMNAGFWFELAQAL